MLGVDASPELGSCDFDGDGVEDLFMATGATWWYSSGGYMPWVYLNTSRKTLSEVRLGYFDNDNRCDVAIGDTVYSGGRTRVLNPFSVVRPGAGVLRR